MSHYYACQLCGRPASLGCPRCSSLFYCSEKHRRLHAAHGHDEEECCRMQAQLSRAKDLQLNWFSWWDSVNGQAQQGAHLDTANAPPGQHPLCRLLQVHRCHDQGIWCHVCPCRPFDSCDLEQHQPASSFQPCSIDVRPPKRPRHQHHPGHTCEEATDPGLLKAAQDQPTSSLPNQPSSIINAQQSPPICPDPVTSPQQPPQAPTPPLQSTQAGTSCTNLHASPLASWRQYYQHQGLPSSSPAALALHFALTAFLGLVTVNHLRGGHLFGLQPPHTPPTTTAATGSTSHTHPDPNQPVAPHRPPTATPPSPSPGADSWHSYSNIVHVLYIGPQAELGMLPTFHALLELLPSGPSLFMHFVGPDVPGAWHGCESGMTALDTPGGGLGRHQLSPAGAAEAGAGEAVAEACSGAMAGSGGSSSGSGSDDWERWLKRVAADVECGNGAASPGPGCSSCGDRQPKLHDSSGGLVQDCCQRAEGASQDVQERGGALGDGMCSGGDAAGGGPAQQLAPGPEVPGAAPQHTLRFSFWQALFHEVHDMLISKYGMTKENTLVIMPNAGLAAYPSWVPTMQLFLASPSGAAAAPVLGEPSAQLDRAVGAAGCEGFQAAAQLHGGGREEAGSCAGGAAAASGAEGAAGVAAGNSRGKGAAAGSSPGGAAGMACVITDYCEEALFKGQAMLQAACGLQGPLKPLLPNPFRQPYLQTTQGNALPSYSNGFMIILNAEQQESAQHDRHVTH